MPVVSTSSSAMGELLPAWKSETDNGGGTHWLHSPPIFWIIPSSGAKISQILQILALFGPVFLDSRHSAAINPPSGAGVLAPLVFAWVYQGKHPAHVESKKPIATDKKPARTHIVRKAGIEHEGRERCSQSSKPAAGSTASFRMMCLR